MWVHVQGASAMQPAHGVNLRSTAVLSSHASGPVSDRLNDKQAHNDCWQMHAHLLGSLICRTAYHGVLPQLGLCSVSLQLSNEVMQ